MMPTAIADRSAFDPLSAGGLLLGVLVLCVGAGALIGWAAGGVPSNRTVPRMLPAVAGSTGSGAGTAGAAAGSCGGAPPHAAAMMAVDNAVARNAPNRTRFIEVTPPTAYYPMRAGVAYGADAGAAEADAAVIFRSTRSCSHCGLHQSTGVTG